MSFSSISGQDSAVSILRRIYQKKLFPHFLIFSGMPGVGKRKAALEFAAALLCPNADEQEGACGACDDCLKIYGSGHADVTFVDFHYQQNLLGGKTAASSLKIDTLREVMRAAALRPFGGAHSICIVDQAEALTAQAQNAALKILEESPPYFIWIWLTVAEELLLPTVLSRAAFRIRFRPLDAAQRAQKLREAGISVGERKECAPRSYAQALELSQRIARFRNYASARRSVLDFLEQLKVELLLRWRSHSDTKAIEDLQKVLQAQRDLEANLAPPLVLEYLLLHMISLCHSDSFEKIKKEDSHG